MIKDEEVLLLIKENQELKKENKELKEIIKELEEKINKNSNNSSKPPSTDWFKKLNKSLRQTDKDKFWWQLGHKWKTLERVDNPDKVEIISPKISNITWEDLSNNEVIREIIYQKIDIEKPKKIVTEYRIQIKKDSKWNLIKPEWLEDILWKWYNNTFYGENLRSFILFLENEHSVSIERISQICFDIFWIKIKNQTVKNISKLAYKGLENFEFFIKQNLIKSKIIHNDETWIRVGWENQWGHVASNENFTLFNIHKKRWKEWVDDMWILENFKWISIHDFWKPYELYLYIKHWYCNSHIIRELNWIIENWKEYEIDFANNMKYLILEIKEMVDKRKEKWFSFLEKEKILEFNTKYDYVINNTKTFFLKEEKEMEEIKKREMKDLNEKKTRW